MLVLPEAVQPRSAPAPPPEILFRPACRTASKQSSQRRWLRKADNHEYFRGEQHVDRVQAWRAKNPGYWRKPALIGEPLQEMIMAQADDRVGKSGSLALQETRPAANPLIRGEKRLVRGHSVTRFDVMTALAQIKNRRRSPPTKDAPPMSNPEDLRQSAQAADPAAREPDDDARDRPRAVAVARSGVEVRPRGACRLSELGGGAGAWRRRSWSGGCLRSAGCARRRPHGAGLRVDPHGNEAP